MINRKIYPFKVKNGTYQEMTRILRFLEVTGIEMDGQVCRVTVTNYTPELSVKKGYLDQYKNDNVYQVRLLNNDDREFIVMSSMLEHLPEPTIVE